MKLSKLMEVWEHLRRTNTGDVRFFDLKRAMESADIDIEYDISPELASEQGSG
jgi:hypothetical protein